MKYNKLLKTLAKRVKYNICTWNILEDNIFKINIKNTKKINILINNLDQLDTLKYIELSKESAKRGKNGCCLHEENYLKWHFKLTKSGIEYLNKLQYDKIIFLRWFIDLLKPIIGIIIGIIISLVFRYLC